VRAIIFDETLELTHRAQEILIPMGVRTDFAGSIKELALAFTGSGPRDLLIAKVTGDAGGWEVAQAVRQARFEGRMLALVDHLAHPGTVYLTQLPRTKCVVRPPTQSLLDALLKTVVAEALRGGPTPRPPLPAFHGIVGKSKEMQEIFSRIDKVAAGDASVCIYGESGTGKELVARAIHYSSARRDQPFVTLDCTAIPEGLMESHLFGHVKGAFTSAIDQRDGVFSLAHMGTLFIDELSELNLSLQAKLLRVIQTREFVKVGGSKPIRSNIRLITATNKDPKRGVEDGTFREDLYYRVAVVMIRMPPLRERREDIPLLVEHYLRSFSAAYHKPIDGVAPEALDRMMEMPWPGNIRQLENFVEQAFVLAEGEILTERDLFLEDPAWASAGAAELFEPGLPLKEVERRHILRTLEMVRGNRTEAAKCLGISVRALQYKLKAYLEEAEQALPGPDPINGPQHHTRQAPWTDS
jgi:DNA-binding NtrC family response regulator